MPFDCSSSCSLLFYYFHERASRKMDVFVTNFTYHNSHDRLVRCLSTGKSILCFGHLSIKKRSCTNNSAHLVLCNIPGRQPVQVAEESLTQTQLSSPCQIKLDKARPWIKWPEECTHAGLEERVLMCNSDLTYFHACNYVSGK